MKELEQSRGLVVVDGSQYGVNDELIDELIQNGPQISEPCSPIGKISILSVRGEFETRFIEIGGQIARKLGLKACTVLAENSFYIDYPIGSELLPHRDISWEGGYRVGLRLMGSGLWVIAGESESRISYPGAMIVQNLGIAVEHSAPPVKESTLTAVWSYELQ